MNKRQFYILLFLVLTSIHLMAVAWEFWVEDIIGALLDDEYESETKEERWEYIISITIFAALSLLYPLFFGRTLIERQEKLTEK